MMSGHVAQMNTTAARFPNVVATIEKPFLSDALVDLVQQTLEAEHTFEKQPDEELLAPTILSEPTPPPLPPKNSFHASRNSSLLLVHQFADRSLRST